MTARVVPGVCLLAAACGSAPSNAVAPPPPSAPLPAPPPNAVTTEPHDDGGAALPDASASATVDAAPSPASTPDTRPRLGSRGYITWIYGQPSRSGQPIGFLRPGTSVALARSEPVAGAGCTGKWFAVEPRGFVCADAATTTDLSDPLFAALHALRPQDQALPYRYAFSLGAPMYGRVPSPEEQQHAERTFPPVDALPRERKPRSGYEELATSDILVGTDPVPAMFTDGAEAPRMLGYDRGLVRKAIPEGSLMSFVAAFQAAGRTWLVTPDLTLVPSDRVRPFRVSAFHGVEIGGDFQLPIAWTRGKPRTKFKRATDGRFVASSEAWPARTPVPITGQSERDGAHVYLETREDGMYIRESDASVVRVPERMPTTVSDDEKWIEFSIGKGTFTLWVGKTPVFSTLASPGAGSAPPRSGMSNEELVRGSHTPIGIYRIEYKTRATTMTPEGTPNPEKHWIADVGYTQYFRRPFAIHTAYWHEDFGNPKSGGCINLSPQDAQRVFAWTEPTLPEEWSGASSSPANGLGTKVVIRR